MFVVYSYEVWGSFVMQLWRTHTGSSQVALLVKNSPASAGDMKDVSLISGSGRSPGGSMATILVFLPGESHGQRSLEGYSP